MAKMRELTALEKSWAARAKSLYEASGMSQLDIGNELGMSQSAIGQYLNGKIPMNLPFKIALASCLKVSVTDIDPDVVIDRFLTADEAKLLRAYRCADHDGKALTLGVAERSAQR